jgi:hypothetical protein
VFPFLINIALVDVPCVFSTEYFKVIILRRMRLAAHVGRRGEGRAVYGVLVGRPKGKRPLRSPRRRWEDSINMDLRDIGIDVVKWIRLAQDRF